MLVVSAINIWLPEMTGFIFAKESSVPLPMSCAQILLRSAVSMKLVSGVGGVVLSTPPIYSETVCLTPHPAEITIKHNIKTRNNKNKLNFFQII